MSEPPPMELGYETAVVEPIGRRPKWVWVIIVIYLLLAAALLLLPFWFILAGNDDREGLVITSVFACVVTLCGLGLVFTRVRIARRRPITRASIWLPLVASGILIGGLVIGAGVAIAEAAKADDVWYHGIFVGGGLVWSAWMILIWLMTRSHDPNSLALWLHRTVFAGSVAELLVAVPCHVIVRRRDECCAGIATGTAICIGCVAMFASLGPGVAFLYYRRWKQIKN